MPKPKRYYAVGLIRAEIDIEVCRGLCGDTVGTNTVSLKWADGMVGAVPVFTDKRKARRFAAGAPIVEMREVQESEDKRG